MSILSGDPLTQLSFSVYENKGVFAVLLGSGLSRAAEIPTGWECAFQAHPIAHSDLTRSANPI